MGYLKKTLALLGVAAALLIVLTLIALLGENSNRAPLDRPPRVGLASVSNVYRVAQLTGDPSINNTNATASIWGTDLGSMFDHKGIVFLSFGDTFAGYGIGRDQGNDWRSTTMAWTTDTTPGDGLSFGGWITDSANHAKELLLDDSGVITTIGTNGVSVGDRMYLHYMSVNYWGVPGEWTLANSGWAYSEDGGWNWNKPAGSQWQGNNAFGQVALVKNGGYIYAFGIPGGRFECAKLGRVLENKILTLYDWQFWNSGSWVTNDMGAATCVVPAPVGELSVTWNDYVGEWLMVYRNEHTNRIVMRTALNLTGPWSDEIFIIGDTDSDDDDVYALFFHPWYSSGRDVYFVLSYWTPYNVWLMHVTLNVASSSYRP
ncbi:hypothetical protein HKBW3S44_00849 [Candidatus Hakubella thermalkaliphila]|uniref:DUF4185 domain-containing protein n=1 Tax=Candidatus Hakubella thermalkaliphila TaxID=2754717 RepID=A0A6V8PX71_9ACTN|nr:DUF4185 domain-containing protein [Candidatus Hakubella thermalkaliphila]GFP22618.1 hypothetical protein HKBW3S09_00086 [Candidatus Hakubella thermalkaliphila]GFP30436.1 hypothetical protein HKBW3S34_01357 [Candidatus Hakubella thermalkaliphila]GFP37169.1 hypothetical protein HKBW3S44_00849 [Candidatus Hakubella thermalkaliphila]GFP39666.1 hypothetical protein HKBW3S47_01364 [Candidatus Hakubella thermalkaliphila]GFP42180.1 hypothetical protein HKBW3C_01306 [Candidatus Hakubella thermalkali